MRAIFFALLSSILLLSASAVTLAAGGGLPADSRGLLFTVQGSNTVGAKLMKNLLTEWLQANGVTTVSVSELATEEYRVEGVFNQAQVYVDVAAHGSTTGFAGLIAGTADLGMASRAIKPAEVESLRAGGDMLSPQGEHVIAIDGLAVIVNSANPLQQLSVTTIKDIFAGKFSNWRQLGGPDLPIDVYARDENSGTWDTFKHLVLGDIPLVTNARRFESNDKLSALVATDPGAIGFVGLAAVGSARALRINDEGTEPLAPSVVTVATEDYLLSRRLYLYTVPMELRPVVQSFIEFVQSDAGQRQVSLTGYIAQAVTVVDDAEAREGPAGYREITAKAERLSVNFRFTEGRAELDNKALRDIARLREYVQRPENAHKRLLLIGFGDTNQSAQRASILSRLRATVLRAALRKEGVMTLPVEGFGAYMPVAANTGGGRIKNRRVEVWVK